LFQTHRTMKNNAVLCFAAAGAHLAEEWMWTQMADNEANGFSLSPEATGGRRLEKLTFLDPAQTAGNVANGEESAPSENKGSYSGETTEGQRLEKLPFSDAGQTADHAANGKEGAPLEDKSAMEEQLAALGKQLDEIKDTLLVQNKNMELQQGFGIFFAELILVILYAAVVGILDCFKLGPKNFEFLDAMKPLAVAGGLILLHVLWLSFKAFLIVRPRWMCSGWLVFLAVIGAAAYVSYKNYFPESE